MCHLGLDLQLRLNPAGCNVATIGGLLKLCETGEPVLGNAPKSTFRLVVRSARIRSPSSILESACSLGTGIKDGDCTSISCKAHRFGHRHTISLGFWAISRVLTFNSFLIDSGDRVYFDARAATSSSDHLNNLTNAVLRSDRPNSNWRDPEVLAPTVRRNLDASMKQSSSGHGSGTAGSRRSWGTRPNSEGLDEFRVVLGALHISPEVVEDRVKSVAATPHGARYVA